MLNLLISFIVLLQTSIYTYSITDVDGQTHNLSSFQGKKILLVNIATGSERVNQLTGLQQLHDAYSDSLVIIAFPSASFGNESRSNAEIKTFCQTTYNTSFIIASKGSVAGGSLQPIYQWLSDSTLNGDLTINIGGDFQKILLDKDGLIIGNFAPAVSPLNSTIIAAITGN